MPFLQVFLLVLRKKTSEEQEKKYTSTIRWYYIILPEKFYGFLSNKSVFSI